MKNTKRFMALLLALVLVFSSMTTAFAAVNEDVVDTDYEVAVGKLNAVGIMEGYPDGTFRPEGQITRAEFAKIAVLSLGLNDAAEVSKSNTIFTDVDAMHWAAGYINVAVDRGILKGYPDGTYKPSNPLSNAEAITILTRLVGLGPVVDREGSWPANYITRANIEGIMDKVAVASTSYATRGNAAKMLVNTLTVNKWGATGYDYDGSVNYGPLTNKTLLNDNLDITIWDAEVNDYLVDDNALEVELFYENGNSAGTEELEVVANMDLYEAYLNEVEIWVNDDDQIIFGEITGTFYVDGVTFDYDANGSEFDLNVLDKSYDSLITSTSNYYVNGEEIGTLPTADVDYHLAKVVLNNKNKVVRIDAYTFDAMTVVEDVDDTVVTGLDGEEVDLDDYTIFKGGKLISLDDVEENDVLFYNLNKDFAEVYNVSETGEVSNVFDATFDLADEEYDYNGVYLKDGDFVTFDKGIAADLEDAEEDATVFFNRLGDIVYVTGELGEADTDTVGAYLLETPVYNTSFTREYVQLVFVNELGTKVTETIKLSDLDVINGADYTTDAVAKTAINLAVQGDVIEVVYDEDGDVVELTTNLNSVSIGAGKIEAGDKYEAGYRLLSGTKIFSIDGGLVTSDDGDVSIIDYSDLEFDIDSANLYVKDAEIVYIVTDSEPSGDDELGFVDASSMRKDGTDIKRLTAWVDGVKTTYVVDGPKTSALTAGQNTDYIYELEISDGKIIGITNAAVDIVTVSTVTGSAVDVSAGEIEINESVDNLKITSDTVILMKDGDDISKISLRNIEDGKKLQIVRVASGSVYVELVVYIK